MPTCLSALPPCSCKSIKLAALFLLSPLFFFGQTLTGLWTGALSNDSTTIRKDQSFEIALTEYRGKVYGYSRSEFIVDDTLYYVVKRVKGTIDGDICEVSDEEIISYNFKGKLDKGIKVTSTFRRNQSDSSWYLAGTWKTNATKKYFSVTGKVDLAEEKDLSASKIFPHLEELNLADQVAFYKERKEVPSVARMVKPETVKTEYSTRTIPVPDNTSLVVAKPALKTVAAKPLTVENDNTVTAIEPTGPSSTTENRSSANTELPQTDPKDKLANTEAPKTESKNIPDESTRLTPVTAKTAGTDNKMSAVEPGATKTIPALAVNNSAQKNEPAVSKTIVPANDRPLLAVNKPAEKPLTKTVAENKNTVVNPSSHKETTAITTNSTQKAEPVKPKEIKAQTKETATIPPLSKDNKNSNTTASLPKPITTVPGEPVATTNRNNVPASTGLTLSPVPEKQVFADILVKTATVAGRKSEFSQVVSFKSDSLELSLYDNGEIDGDTVSIFLNGEVLLSKQGLKASAIKKTVYITPDLEDFTLVLFAENLGKYPPNTGLLVVHDGDDVYNLRFSADYQKNAGIVFRRKK